ncbi:hypothetical protein ACWCV9_06515 [Streptomyces sp. NPDC001606]
MTANMEELEAALSGYEEARKSRVAASVEEALPSHIRGIKTTSVVINMDPSMLPLSQVEPEIFLRQVEDKFKLGLKPPQVLSNLQEEFAEAGSLPKEKVLAIALREEAVSLEAGRVPVGQNVIVPIEMVKINDENISALVSGHTEVAEYVTAEIFEMMWFAAGAPKRWESPEVQESIQLKSYGTVTRVDLGCSLNSLLAPQTLHYLEQNLATGGRFAGEMMSKSAADNFTASPDIVSTFAVDEIDMKVNLFNTRTGRSETANVKLSVMSRDDLNRGLCDVLTQLPIDKHSELVRGLAQAVTA